MKKVVFALLLLVSNYQLKKTNPALPVEKKIVDNKKEKILVNDPGPKSKKKEKKKRKIWWLLPSVGLAGIAYIALGQRNSGPNRLQNFPQERKKEGGEEEKKEGESPLFFEKTKNKKRNNTYLERSKKEKLNLAQRRLKRRKKTAFPNSNRKKIHISSMEPKKPPKILLPSNTNLSTSGPQLVKDKNKEEPTNLFTKKEEQKNHIYELLQSEVPKVRIMKRLPVDSSSSSLSENSMSKDSLFDQVEEEKKDFYEEEKEIGSDQNKRENDSWQEKVLETIKTQHHYNKTFKLEDDDNLENEFLE